MESALNYISKNLTTKDCYCRSRLDKSFMKDVLSRRYQPINIETNKILVNV